MDSTSSAVWRSAISRSAARFSTRKKLLSAAGTRSAGYTLPSRRRPISASGVRSTSTTSSAEASTLSGKRLAHAHAGQLGHAVVERLEVLDVDRGEHVDARVEHVLDVLVALAVLEAGRVGVGQLVDQAELGGPAKDGGQVHLVDRGAAVLDLAAGQALEALGLRLGLGSRVRLEVADHHVTAGGALGLALLQHAVGLADPRGHAQEDLVVASHGARRRARCGSRGRSA